MSSGRQLGPTVRRYPSARGVAVAGSRGARSDAQRGRGLRGSGVQPQARERAGRWQGAAERRRRRHPKRAPAPLGDGGRQRDQPAAVARWCGGRSSRGPGAADQGGRYINHARSPQPAPISNGGTPGPPGCGLTLSPRPALRLRRSRSEHGPPDGAHRGAQLAPGSGGDRPWAAAAAVPGGGGPRAAASPGVAWWWWRRQRVVGAGQRRRVRVGRRVVVGGGAVALLATCCSGAVIAPRSRPGYSPWAAQVRL